MSRHVIVSCAPGLPSTAPNNDNGRMNKQEGSQHFQFTFVVCAMPHIFNPLGKYIYIYIYIWLKILEMLVFV